MTKAQLIEQIAKNAGISKAGAGKALNSFIDSIGEKPLKRRMEELHSLDSARFQKFIGMPGKE